MRENLASSAVSLAPEDIALFGTLESGTRIGADPAVAAHSQM
jgi:hypothetical protein